jgi:hypothetical protein
MGEPMREIAQSYNASHSTISRQEGVTMKSNIACKSVGIVLALIGTSYWVPASLAQVAEPSLTETLSWMDSTYNPHSDTGGAWGHGIEEIYTNGKLFKRRTSMFTYDGCEISLHTQDDPASPLYNETASGQIYKFNLRDIDGKSITLNLMDPQYGGLSCDYNFAGNMQCSVAEMVFETRNQAPLMDVASHTVFPKLKGDDHDANSNRKTFVAELYIDDAEYANRFVKAFRHVAVLCGGTPSPF